jgi:hypothetical protein
MAAGLQVWDAQGRLIVDTSTLVPRSVYIGEVTDTGSASIVAIAQGQAIGVPQVTPIGNEPVPEVNLDGATLYWKRGGGGNENFRAFLNVTLL